MTKIRLIFIGTVFLLLVIGVVSFNSFKDPVEQPIEPISEFKITQISGNGNVYFSKTPIESGVLSRALHVDIKRMDYGNEFYLRSDKHTSFQFYCFGTTFVVRPSSYLYFQPKTKEIRFFEGECSWEKKKSKKAVEIAVPYEDPDEPDAPPQVLTLSNSGRLQIESGELRIWNHHGELTLNRKGETTPLPAKQMLIAPPGQDIVSNRILAAPEFISPVEKVISIKVAEDSVVTFNWKVVSGARNYLFRIYPSPLAGRRLFEREVDSNRLKLDLLQFDDFGEYYWQVVPLDPGTNIEGIPSKLGFLKLVGALLNKEEALKPPELHIKRLGTNGNLVLIEGSTDKNSSLYINDEPVTVTLEGQFIYTIHFKQLGKNKITFRVVSPMGTETVVERYATIYDE